MNQRTIIPLDVSIQNVKNQFQPNYESNYNCFTRRFLFLHLLEVLFHVKSKSNEDKNIEKQDVPNIKSSDDAQMLSEEFLKNLGQITKAQSQEGLITSSAIFKSVYATFKDHIIFIFFIYFLDLLNRIALTFTLQHLLASLVQGNYTVTYVLAGILSLILYFQVILRHNQFYQSPILGGRMKSCLVIALLKKVSFLNQFVSNKAQIGKITNMLSNDFNMIQIKAPFFFTLTIVPFVYIAFIIVLTLRLGWQGLLCIITPLIFLPLQTWIGKINGKILTQLNIHKDKRVKLASQLIQGIKHIKIYGWQLIFNRMIKQIRLKQLGQYIKLAFGRSVESALSESTAFIGCYISFLLIAYTDNNLTDAKIFSTLEFISFLKISTQMSSLGIGFLYEMQVVFQRFANIMNLKTIRMNNILQLKKKQKIESQKLHQYTTQKILDRTQENFEINLKVTQNEKQKTNKVKQCQLEKGQIQLKNFNAFWKDNFDVPTLKNLTFKLEQGKFYGLSGKVGSGKSALIGTFIQELPYYSGYFNIKGKVSYAEQEPILFSSSIKENILFGRPYIERRYKQVIQASCFISDLKLFPFRDQTLIGEKGVTLSGGQKARLILARSLYEQADIYIFDDPLSAVDTKVAKKIFDQVICGYLKDKTVILSTHQIHFLQTCENIIVLEDGQLIAFDKYNKVQKYIKQMSLEQEKEVDEQKQSTFQNPVAKEEPKQLSEITQHEAQVNEKQKNIKINWQSYTTYFFYWSSLVFFLSIVLIIFDEVLYAFFYRFLTFNQEINNGGEAMFGLTGKNNFWILLGALCVGYLVFGVFKYFTLYLCILKSNSLIHEDMIMSLSRAKPYYFDIMPSGIFINKISNDIGLLDSTLIFSVYYAIQGMAFCIVLLVNIFQIDYYQIIIGVSGVILIVIVFIYCKITIIQTKQLDLKLKSPVFKGLNQLISGLVQINLFQRRVAYMKQLAKRMNDSLRANLGYWFMCRVFGAYTTFVLLIVSIASIFVGIGTIDQNNSGLYAVTVVFFLNMIQVVQWTARQLINTESTIVSAERCIQMTKLQHQKDLYTNYDELIGIKKESEFSKSTRKDQWPKNPNVVLKDFRFKYRDNLPLVLKGLDFELKSGQKVGLVGRTGAGKSSIIQALLRLGQPQDESVFKIDNCDALKMGLHSLRTHISVIPQQPFLFKGSIRKNIDPFDIKTDQQIWKALQSVKLRQFIQALPQKLQTDLSNSIQVFSVGQKQLFCLSRVLLNRTKIIILDEATSSIDFQTDHFIQQIIRAQFKQQTVITIAHRLNTLTDYDKIIVMDKGKVYQMGSPQQLMQIKGKFYEMVTYTGKGMKDLIKAIFKMQDNNH